MSEHKFRYLLPPGSQFKFVQKFKAWIWASILLTIATATILIVNKSQRGEYMNWTIDFIGGTEITFAFKKDGQQHKADPQAVREALAAAGEHNAEVSETTWEIEDASGKDVTVTGMLVRTPRFSSMKPEQAEKAQAAFREQLKHKGVEKTNWSGERFYVRSTQSLVGVDATAAFAAGGLEVKPWSDEEKRLYDHADEGTGEYHSVYAVWGLDRQFSQIIGNALPGTEVQVVQSYGVGAKAGSELRTDAIKSLFYAILLIMLYLAFRFDIRYAPGAAFAVIHDAVMVIGVFALTWTEVSLTTVAALLTVMGYSVNETVISFDRIRENEAKLKDKSIEKIIDISINERLTRTIMTASTVFATTLVMNIFGSGLVKNFAFAMNIGVIVATYSSIFLAAPIFLWTSKRWYSGPAKQRAYKQHAVQAEE
jgi:preprotein translocase subunit SecF